MTAVLAAILGVMLLPGPDTPVDRKALARLSSEADEGMRSSRPFRADEEKSAKISSVRSDFDRNAGVVMFEQDVCVEYAADYVMHADRLFVFLGGSNELSRIVAIGNVAITNDTRIGSCAMAKFWKRSSEIEMYGDGGKVQARLSEGGAENELAGSRIRFWLDSEQVDVDNSDIKVERQDGGKIL